MDILTHIVSGAAVGTVFSAFSGRGIIQKLKITAIAGAGAFFPDYDAISLWQSFDGTIGKLIAPEHSGKEIYFSKFWYSHHGAMHSLSAAILIAFLAWLFVYFLFLKNKQTDSAGFLNSLKQNSIPLTAFVTGFSIHLLEDMITPACVWGGVWFFWPFGGFIGGTGDIWWWNNYDIFLIISGVLFINLIVLTLGTTLKLKIQKLSLIIFIAGLVLSFYQAKSRSFDFNYTGHTPLYDQYEIESNEIQKEVLGKKLYKLMECLDNKIPFHF